MTRLDKLDKIFSSMSDWQFIASALLVALVLAGVFCLFIFWLAKRSAEKEREEADPLFCAETYIREGRREQRREKRRWCNPLKGLKKHWFWASFVLFWSFIIIISILYEYGIVR